MTIEAAAEANGPKKFSLLAYTGAAMQLPGYFHKVVVDVAGLVASGTQPILRNHDPERIVGHSQTVAIARNGEVTLGGVMSGMAAEVEPITSTAKSGFPWQASIGASVERMEFVDRGEKVSVNGRTFTGPLFVARASTLREVSFVPIGADAGTSASIAAAHTGSAGKVNVMEFTDYVSSVGFDPATLTDSQKAALTAGWKAAHPPAAPNPHGAAADPDTIRGFFDREIRANGNTWQKDELLAACDLALANNFTAQQAELLAVRTARGPGVNNRQPVNGRRNDDGNVITASLLIGLGMQDKVVAKHFDDRTVDVATSQPHRGVGLQGMFRRVIQAAGGHAPSGRFGDSGIRDAFDASVRLKASGLSTISIPGILSNVANKILLESFDGTAMTWGLWCKVGSNVDFKEATRYRMTGEGQFEEIAPGGEIRHVTLTEASAAARLRTYGAMIALERQSIINDDLSAFAAVPRVLGRMSAIKVEKAVYTKLLANASSFFGSGNANYESGGGSALAAAGLAAAKKKFRNQTDANGDPLMMDPAVLLVPEALDVTARQLMRDVQVVASTTANTPIPSGNPWANYATVVTAPYLGTAFGLPGASDTGWYLTVGPSDFSPVEVNFLNGQMRPTVETADLDFNRLGVQMRAYHDFGVNFLEHRGAVFSAGV